MKKGNWIIRQLYLLLLCLTLSGCAGEAFLQEIPRDMGIGSGEEKPAVSAEEPESVTPEEREISFLWDMPDGYAYSCLNEAEQIWYRDMEAILGSHLEEKALSGEGLEAGLDDTDIDYIFQCVLNDHPELFYIDGYSYTKYTEGDSITDIAFSGTYNVDLETAMEKQRLIEEGAAAILAGISENASEYDRVKYVYDTLILETDYDLEAEDNQNIYSVFVNHASVCQGYAKAAQYLLNRLGVNCTLVLGTVYTGEGHAWNLVEIDGAYYYMDATWGDASYQMEEGMDEQKARPEINYDYLNVTTEDLCRTHTIDSGIPMPYCDTVAANYYLREGALFSEYDREQMRALFERMGEDRTDITIKCTNEACYQEIYTALIEGQEIFQYMKAAGDSVAYAQNDKQLSLTFWVTNEM